MSFLYGLLAPRVRDPHYLSLVSRGNNKRRTSQDHPEHIVSISPKLYTKEFGSCQENNGALSLDRLHVAYYAEDARLVFQLNGTTNDTHKEIRLHWLIHAYGEDRLHIDHDPCQDNLDDLCPIKANNSIESTFGVDLSPPQSQKLNFLANPIPDLDGYARLQVSSGNTQEIGCYQAALTTGHSLSQPQYFGAVLVFFALAATLSSFLTATYGASVPHIRRHYAHSVSVLSVLETFQSIFFTGAISVDWPAVLPAWWSNFAWSVGLVPEKGLIRALGNSTGFAKHSLDLIRSKASISIENYEEQLDAVKLNVADYLWSGNMATPGLTLPGHWHGFMGTISRTGIPPNSAAMISLIWLITALVVVFVSICMVKGLLELHAKLKLLKSDGFDYFRRDWLAYVGVFLGRVFYAFFFPLATLSCFQMTLREHAGPTVVSALVLLIALGFFGAASGHLYYSLRRLEKTGDDVELRDVGSRRATILSGNTEVTQRQGEDPEDPTQRIGKNGIQTKNSMPADFDSIANPPKLYECYSWLFARYREARWWFFAFSLTFQFIRATLLGGAMGNAKAQISGLLTIDIVYLVLLIVLNPFESNRNTAMSIMLSFSNIISTSLTIGLLPQLELDSLYTQIIGFIIVILQGALTLAVLILVAIGLATTGLSLSRNREDSGSRFDRCRVYYFGHVEKPTRYKNRVAVENDAERVASNPEGEAAKEAPQDNSGDRNGNRENEAATSQRDEIEGRALSNDRIDEEFIPSVLSHRHSIHTTIPAGPRLMPSTPSNGPRPRSLNLPRRSCNEIDFKLWDAASLETESRRMTRKRSRSLRMQAVSSYGGSGSSDVGEVKPLGPRPEPSVRDFKISVKNEDIGFRAGQQEEDITGDQIDGVRVGDASQPQNSEFLTVPEDNRTSRGSNRVWRSQSWLDEFRGYCHVIAEEDEGEDEGALVDETTRQIPMGPRPQPKGTTLNNDQEERTDQAKAEDGCNVAANANDRSLRSEPPADTPRITVSAPPE